MNILVLANRDLASNHALNILLPQISHHNVTLCLSAKVGEDHANKPAELNRLRFFEQDLFNNLLTPAIESNNAKAASSGKKYKTFSQLSCYLTQEIQELNKINSPEQLKIVQALRPDLIICIRYGVILQDQVLAIPTKGTINLHSGKLPDFRGVMATFWAMLHGESHIGTTLHFIDDSNIDTGHVIATSSIRLDVSKSYLWHVLQLYVSAVQLIMDTVTLVENNKNIPTIAQSDEGQYFTFPTIKDIETFNKMGHTLVDEVEITDFITEHYLD